jgi:hypothetical protein
MKSNRKLQFMKDFTTLQNKSKKADKILKIHIKTQMPN